MTFFQSIILGIVEGITEFLPVSSTAHLIIADKLLAIEQSEFLKSFEIVIQLGAVCAVLFLYARTIHKYPSLIGKIIAGFIPTAVIGLVLYSFIKTYLLGNLTAVFWGLLIGGVALIAYELYEKRRTVSRSASQQEEKSLAESAGYREISAISYPHAAIIGTLQAIAVIPGVSRSAVTIITGRALGLSKTAATEFSFLLALPTIAAAAAYDILKNPSLLTSSDHATLIAVGFVVSFITALVAIRFLLSFVRRYSLAWFGVYRIVVALLLLWFVL